MKITDSYMESRTSKDLMEVSSQEYFLGLVYITKYLFGDLDVMLEIEGRHFGIVDSYMEDIEKSLSNLFPADVPPTEIETRILFLYKPMILAEYRKLLRRKLSPADSVITLIKKIFEIIQCCSDIETGKNFKRLRKVIEKLHNNIRNQGKNSKLFFFTNTIKRFMNEGIVGAYTMKSMSIISEEEKKKNKNTSEKKLEGDVIGIKNISEEVITEISL